MLWSITFYNDCAVDRTYIFFRWFSFHLQFFLFRLQFWNRLSCWFHLPSWRFSLSTSPTTSYTSFKSQIKLITSWRFEIKDFAERERNCLTFEPATTFSAEVWPHMQTTFIAWIWNGCAESEKRCSNQFLNDWWNQILWMLTFSGLVFVPRARSSQTKRFTIDCNNKRR